MRKRIINNIKKSVYIVMVAVWLALSVCGCQKSGPPPEIVILSTFFEETEDAAHLIVIAYVSKKNESYIKQWVDQQPFPTVLKEDKKLIVDILFLDSPSRAPNADKHYSSIKRLKEVKSLFYGKDIAMYTDITYKDRYTKTEEGMLTILY